MSKSFAIVPGFAEGRWHMKNLIRELEASGYELAETAAEADIIIAHSGGCYFLPKLQSRQLIVLIGPPYWPGKPLLLSLVQKLYLDFVDCVSRGMIIYWLQKTFWNTLYLLRDLLLAASMGLKARKQDFYKALAEHKVMIIRNQQDSWCSTKISAELSHNKHFSFHALPGQHDDCWHNPRPYVKLIEKNYGLLAKTD